MAEEGEDKTVTILGKGEDYATVTVSYLCVRVRKVVSKINVDLYNAVTL